MGLIRIHEHVITILKQDSVGSEQKAEKCLESLVKTEPRRDERPNERDMIAQPNAFIRPASKIANIFVIASEMVVGFVVATTSLKIINANRNKFLCKSSHCFLSFSPAFMNTSMGIILQYDWDLWSWFI